MFQHWKTLAALALIYLGALMGWQWPWALLFLMWTLPALKLGRTHLIEDIDRQSDPWLFWLIVGTWICFSLYLLFIDIIKLLS